jgi:hypothetical protein
MVHKPTLSQASTVAILGPNRVYSSETKGQCSSDPTSYATTTTHSKNQPKSNAQHQKTEKNQVEPPNPQERPYRQGPLESLKFENHQAETTPQYPHPIAGTQKANYIHALNKSNKPESDLVTHVVAIAKATMHQQ